MCWFYRSYFLKLFQGVSILDPHLGVSFNVAFFLEATLSFVELFYESTSSCIIKFGFHKGKQSKCVNFVKNIFYAIFFIFWCLQPTSCFYYMLEPNVVNHHSLAKSSLLCAMCKHGKDLDLSIMLKFYFCAPWKVSILDPPPCHML